MHYLGKEKQQLLSFLKKASFFAHCSSIPKTKNSSKMPKNKTLQKISFSSLHTLKY